VTAADEHGRTFELRHIDCPTCSVRAFRVLGVRGGPRAHRYGLGIETNIVECTRCGLLFPDPFPVPRDHDQLYADPAKYFENHGESAKIEDYVALAREIRRRTGLTQPRVLDVGSGRGELLVAFRAAGLANAVGLEFAQAMIDYARETHGIALEKATIEAYAASDPEPFDAITLCAVLEHVYDPDAMIRASAKLLRPGGVLYLDIPNEPHLLSQVAGAFEKLRGRDVVYHLAPTWAPFHLFGFNRRALTVLLRKHAFAIESVRVHAGTMLPHTSDLADRAKALVGHLVKRIANLTGRAHNMVVWARKER